MLNNSERPPVLDEEGREIKPGQPIIHFSEVDECPCPDPLLTNCVHTAFDLPVEITLHELRWGDEDRNGDNGFVRVFEISGATPPAYHIDGFAGSVGYRQPPMYFRLGGSTLAGIAKPGAIVWSRIFVEGNALHLDIGTGQALALSVAETKRRLDAPTPRWPIIHAQLDGIDRDKMMARKKGPI